MKALLIASVLFFSLRAMSAEEVGEDKKGECIHSDQSAKRVAKMIPQETVKTKVETVKSISK